LTGHYHDAAKAATAFEQARALGNETPQLLGMQGDAYYRVYRDNGRPELLALAIDRKQQARDAGGISRENLSLSAKLSFARWQLALRFEDLTDAVSFVAAAHEIAPNWPWPPFQLAELLDDLDPRLSAAAVAAAAAQRPAALLNMAARGGQALAECGARLVVANEEFGKMRLGGTGQRVRISHARAGAATRSGRSELQGVTRDREPPSGSFQFVTYRVQARV
jgi:hypothetical protein